MSCKLKVIANIADGSRLEYFCDPGDPPYNAVAEFRCEKGDHHEAWDHDEIALPATKKKVLSAACMSYAVDATVAIFSNDQTTVKVIARIKPPAGDATEFTVCTVEGKNGTVEFPRLLIIMK